MRQASLILCVFCYVIISCNGSRKQENFKEFNGVGQLILGSTFDSIGDRNKFKEQHYENTVYYSCDKYLLTDSIGPVEDVRVETCKGKIHSVSFSTSKYTKEYFITSLYSHYTPKDLIGNENEDYHVITYDNPNSNVSITESYNRDIAILEGFPQRDYSYHDKKTSIKLMQEKDSIEKQNYMQDIK